MNECHWENKTYCKKWIETNHKKPKYVRFWLVSNEKGEPDMIFRFTLQPTVGYNHPNYANSISLELDHEKFMVVFNATWSTYCDMGYSLDERMKTEMTGII